MAKEEFSTESVSDSDKKPFLQQNSLPETLQLHVYSCSLNKPDCQIVKKGAVSAAMWDMFIRVTWADGTEQTYILGDIRNVIMVCIIKPVQILYKPNLKDLQ